MCRGEKDVLGDDVPANDEDRPCVFGFGRDLGEGSRDEDASVDIVPERVAALSVSQLDPDVRGVEDDAAVTD